jgi:hypothetical protein
MNRQPLEGRYGILCFFNAALVLRYLFLRRDWNSFRYSSTRASFEMKYVKKVAEKVWVHISRLGKEKKSVTPLSDILSC